MRRKIFFYLSIFFGFIVVLYVAFFWLFPTRSLEHFIEESISKQFKYKQRAKLEKLSLSPLLSASAQALSISPIDAEGSDPRFETQAGDYNGYYCPSVVDIQAFKIQDIKLSFSPLSLLKASPIGKFSLHFADGQMNGQFKVQNKDKFQLSAQIQNLALDRLELLSNFTGAQFYGRMQVDAEVSGQASRLSELKLDLSIDDIVLCPKRIKLERSGVPFFEIPFTSFGQTLGKIQLEEQVATIDLKTSGPDMQVSIQGSIQLPQNGEESELALDITLLPSADWLERNSMGIIYQLCQRQEEGSIFLKLSGTPRRLKHDCGSPAPIAIAPRPTTKAPLEPKPAEPKPAVAMESAPKAPDTEPLPPGVVVEDGVRSDKVYTAPSLPPNSARPRREFYSPEQLVKQQLPNLQREDIPKQILEQIENNPQILNKAQLEQQIIEIQTEVDLALDRRRGPDLRRLSAN